MPPLARILADTDGHRGFGFVGRGQKPTRMKTRLVLITFWLTYVAIVAPGYWGGNAVAQMANLNAIHAFMVTDGAFSYAELALGNDGNFYGTTYGGGNYSSGTVFRITTSGVFTSLLSFSGMNGANPRAGLTLGPDGNFYGTTQYGGSNNLGTVFKINPSGTMAWATSFDGTNDNGSQPISGLVLAADGNFYGTTPNGGSNNVGTVFRVTTNGVLTPLLSFPTYPYYYGQPAAELALAPDGDLYGTGMNGGNSSCGSVFRVTTNGVLHFVAEFNLTNGCSPAARLTWGGDGYFYGTTSGGGAIMLARFSGSLLMGL